MGATPYLRRPICGGQRVPPEYSIERLTCQYCQQA